MEIVVKVKREPGSQRCDVEHCLPCCLPHKLDVS